jgi:AcrR family transcriptional regulator
VNAFIETGARKVAKAATRARVLEAAKAQLETLGFDGTSIRGVAQAAGVATGTVLLHFADKRDLLHAAVFDDLERTWAAVKKKKITDKKSKRAPSIERELLSIVKAFFDYYAARPALSRVLLRESLFAEAPWNARFAAQVADVHQHVVRIVVDAQARREVRADIDPNVFGAAFFSFYYFALLAWLQGGHENPQRLFERMLRQHLGTPQD